MVSYCVKTVEMILTNQFFSIFIYKNAGTVSFSIFFAFLHIKNAGNDSFGVFYCIFTYKNVGIDSFGIFTYKKLKLRTVRLHAIARHPVIVEGCTIVHSKGLVKSFQIILKSSF